MSGSDDAVALLAPFVALLGRSPAPAAVAEALVTGPGAAFGGIAAVLHHVEGESLVLLGAHGFAAEELAGYDRIPLAVDLPLSETVREGITVVTSPKVAGEYEGLREDTARWERMRARQKHGSVVSVPISTRGVVAGTFALSCPTGQEWDPRDLAFLDAIGAALALWFLHPSSGLDDPVSVDDPVVELTDRQRAIVVLLDRGRTTAQIGDELGYSPSTIKQEIGRVMHELGTPTRAALVDRLRELGLLPEERP